MLSRKIQIFIAIIVVLVIGYGLMQMFMGMKTQPPQRPAEEAKIYVKAETVKYATIIPQVNEGGRLGSQNTVDVISEVQGQILKGDVPLKKGQRFKKGNLLAQIFDGEAQNNLKASKSRFLNTLANALPDLKIDFVDNYSAWLNFFHEIDISENLPEIPSAKSDKEKTFLASRNILNDYYTIKSSEIRLEKYAIHAPFDGSFISVNFEVGSTVNPGSRLGTIIQTNRLELEVPVKTQDIHWLNIGDNVKISSGVSDVFVGGTIVRISDFVKPETQSVSVFVNIKSQSKIKLFEGMYLNATFKGEALSNVMEIPRNSVFNENDVFLVENDKLKLAAIKVHKVNEKTLIFSGIPEGEILVVEPLINVSEGMKVEILK